MLLESASRRCSEVWRCFSEVQSSFEQNFLLNCVFINLNTLTHVQSLALRNLSQIKPFSFAVGPQSHLVDVLDIKPQRFPISPCGVLSFQVDNESNTLQDGSLIDLCGATLLWRTPAGLRHTPTLKQLESLRQELNAARPQCPVGFNTLAFPSLAQREIVDKKQPWVYVNCGHVHGYHNWGYRKDKGPAGPGGTAPASTGERECPMCRQVGPYVPLWLGCEGGLYLDAGPPTHAFCPCGHVCSEKTVNGWSQIPLPHGTHAFHAACPFCGTWLTGEQGYIRLIFQGPVD